MEAMWLRFRPLVKELQTQIFDKKIIGDVRRTFCDFGLPIDLAALGPESRLKNPALGAGSLSDIVIYSLTWKLLTLDDNTGNEAEQMDVLGMQTIQEDIDTTSTVVLKYPSSGRQGIFTLTLDLPSSSFFCRIEGTEGYAESSSKAAATTTGSNGAQSESDVWNFDEPGFGFYHEADAVALDIAAGRLESKVMPHAETLRVLKILDEVRRQGGARFSQDEA